MQQTPAQPCSYPCPCRRHDVTKIDRALQPLELLKYLSEIVVSLVERLPKPDAASRQRQLAASTQRHGASATAASGGASGGGRPAGKAVVLTSDGDISSQLAAAEVAESDLTAMLRELGALEDDSVPSPAAARSSSGAGQGASSSGVAPAAAAQGGDGEAAPATPAPTEQPQEDAGQQTPSPPSVGDAAGGGSMGGSITARMAQLQRGVNRAMQALGSLRSSSAGAGGSADEAATAALDVQAGAESDAGAAGSGRKSGAASWP